MFMFYMNQYNDNTLPQKYFKNRYIIRVAKLVYNSFCLDKNNMSLQYDSYSWQQQNLMVQHNIIRTYFISETDKD